MMLAQIPNIMLGWISQCVNVFALTTVLSLSEMSMDLGRSSDVRPWRESLKDSGDMQIKQVSSSSVSRYSISPSSMRLSQVYFSCCQPKRVHLVAYSLYGIC